jgi:CheY-like chemotaxis protein
MTQSTHPRILIIDDDEAMLESLAAIVSGGGYLPIEASGGMQGIELALRSPPHLILCDLLMPVMDGFGVLARLRSEPATSAIPFVFVTSSTVAEDSRTGFLLGASDYVTKPVDPTALLSLIGQRLGEATGSKK